MRKASLKSRKWMFLFFEPSLIQKKVLEGLWDVGGAFNENETSKLHNSEILKQTKKENKPELSNLDFLFSFFYSKVSKLRAMTSQFDLTLVYDVIICNSVF